MTCVIEFNIITTWIMVFQNKCIYVIISVTCVWLIWYLWYILEFLQVQINRLRMAHFPKPFEFITYSFNFDNNLLYFFMSKLWESVILPRIKHVKLAKIFVKKITFKRIEVDLLPEHYVYMSVSRNHLFKQGLKR